MMSPTQLQSAVASQIRNASGGIQSEITTHRADLFDRYMGEKYGDEKKDRSSVIDSTISDTVEWIMPELMEIFTSGDKVCVFEPQGPEDEEAAEQETDAVNYVFYRQNDGFIELYQFLKDGLIQKNGYFKRWWEEKEKVTTEEYRGLDAAGMLNLRQQLEQDGIDYELEGHEEDEEGISFELKLTRVEEKLCVQCVPPEEILVSPQWHSVNLDGCPFVAHRRSMTVSDLVEMGYDRKQVEKLPSSDEEYISEEKIDRFTTRGSAEYSEDIEHDPAMREVLVHECYLYLDHDEDGVAELRKVTVGGEGYEILKWQDGELDNEQADDLPISSWSPVVVPHRHYGRSVAELVEDLQRIKTVLFRQMLDNIYLNNFPTKEIAKPGIEEGETIEDMLVARPGRIIRTAQPGMYVEHRPNLVTTESLQAIEYVDTVRENRSGVNRYNQGMDANSLNKTASGMRQILNQGQKKVALIARIVAETGLKHLFRGIHADLRRNAGRELKMRLRNRFIQVDPKNWRDRSDMTVSVGLGNGDRETRMAYIAQIIQEQKENILAGSPLATPAQLFNSYERFTEGAGFKSPEEFFINPANAQPQPQKESTDPAEAAYMIEQMKAQMDQETKLLIEKQRLDFQREKLFTEAAGRQAEMSKDFAEMHLKDDRERDMTVSKLAVELQKMQAKGETQISIEALRQMMQPPHVAV